LQLVTEHILRAYEDLRAIATPIEFPTRSEVLAKLTEFNALSEDEMKGHPTVEWVSQMRETLRGDTTDADMSIWTEAVMERLDFLFMDNIKNTGHVGLSTTAGAGDLARYHTKLIDNLATQWRPMTEQYRWALGKIT
jgi:hypothetical protein